MVYCGLFAALLTICAWLAIPVGDIAFTMQTFGVFLALGLLGGKWGTVSILIYLLLGAVGMPVFSGFQGGFGVLLGVTGGYLWGFLVSGLVYWGLERFGKLLAMIAGLLACYACGSAWFLYWSGGGLIFVLLRCVIPYIIPDAVKLGLAYSLSRRLSKHLH
ncbi:MAG: biotin transporter BioY [Oscillospiraceae bacterium]|nr:biotin transporter BioY [Oscillospiraceae bacterium]